jgi:hypothetical protein
VPGPASPRSAARRAAGAGSPTRAATSSGARIAELGCVGPTAETLRFLDALPGQRFAPAAPGVFAAFDVRTGIVVRAACELPPAGPAAALTLRSGDGRGVSMGSGARLEPPEDSASGMRPASRRAMSSGGSVGQAGAPGWRTETRIDNHSRSAKGPYMLDSMA